MSAERTAILKLADAVEQLRFILVGSGSPAADSHYKSQVALIDAAVSEVRSSLGEDRS